MNFKKNNSAENNSCGLCNIISHTNESILVRDFGDICVFLDYRPIEKGHVIVVPKKCIANLTDTTDEEFSRLNAVAKYMCSVLEETYSPPKVGMFISGYEDIDHLHIHVLPLFDKLSKSMSKKRVIDFDGVREELGKITKNIDDTYDL